ncbi:MAG TPA: hypothetical protein VGM88_11715 [Kofleriaceae bacterium]|jgi:hypothetical protein
MHTSQCAWLDFFRVARDAASYLRDDELVQVPSGHSVRIPRTTTRDVIRIAAVVDNFARGLPRSRALWAASLRAAANAALDAEYVDNRLFWGALALVATEAGCFGLGVPDAKWLLVQLTQRARSRNADGTSAATKAPPPLDWITTFYQERNQFAASRAQDVVAGGLPERIPRTTVADARQLVRAWSSRLAAYDQAQPAHAQMIQKSTRARWSLVVAAVTAQPAANDGALYVANTELWRAALDVAEQLDAVGAIKLTGIDGWRDLAGAAVVAGAYDKTKNPDDLRVVASAATNAPDAPVMAAVGNGLWSVGSGVANGVEGVWDFVKNIPSTVHNAISWAEYLAIAGVAVGALWFVGRK